MNLTLIDADSLVWTTGYKYRDNTYPTFAFHSLDSWVHDILEVTQATHYLGFLGGTRCHRYQIATTKPYKGSRPPKPEWFLHWGPILTDHLKEQWGFHIVDGVEADDACGIGLSLFPGAVVASPDKDLKQLPGTHYNFNTKDHCQVSPEDGARNFWTQMVVGDTSDNISGLPMKGPAYAKKLLGGLTCPLEMERVVSSSYESLLTPKGINWEEYFQEQYQLLRLLETEQYGFQCPQPIPIPQVQEPVLESIDHLFN